MILLSKDFPFYMLNQLHFRYFKCIKLKALRIESEVEILLFSRLLNSKLEILDQTIYI